MPKQISLKISADCDDDCSPQDCECARIEQNVVDLVRLLHAPGAISQLRRMIEAERVWDDFVSKEASR